MAGFPQPQHFIAAGCLFIQFWWPLYSVSSETLRFDRYRDRDLSRLQNFKDVETETQRDSRIWRMSRPRLIETKNFRGCRDRDSSRLKNLEDVETETDRDLPKGVETETESLATHCLKHGCKFKFVRCRETYLKKLITLGHEWTLLGPFFTKGALKLASQGP